VRVEWLRHTGASLAYAPSKDLKATSARLGHVSTRMIDTVYLKLYDEVGRQVADAIDELVRASLTRETDH
jgi:integrase